MADQKNRYAARKFAEHVEQVNAIPNLDEHTKAQAIESFVHTAAARDAEASISAAQAYRDELAARPGAERARLATASDPAAQTAGQRQWDRDKAKLEAQSNVGQIHATAANLVNNATPDQLAMLAEELPSWLAAKGRPTQWVNDAIPKAVPQLGEACEQATAAERRLLKLRHNARVNQNAYKAQRPVDPRMVVDPT